MSGHIFNINNGYLEGIIRGLKNDLLQQSDFQNLVQCDTLEDIRLFLQGTDYGNFLSSETLPLTVPIIESKLRERLVVEFNHVRCHSCNPLTKFLDFISYAYMIDNIVLLITGILNKHPMHELLKKCHPLGNFDQMDALHVANSPAELYNAIIIDTPLAQFFNESMSEEDINEMNIELIRNLLYKSYIDEFHKFSMSLGGVTAEVMDTLLSFEADRRAVIITLNSIGSELSKDDRKRLFPNCGKLNPDGYALLSRAEDHEHVYSLALNYADYESVFGGMNNVKTVDDRFLEREVQLHANSFLQHFHFGLFYSYFRIKEQECRNIVWIAECISQKQRHEIENFVSFF